MNKIYELEKYQSIGWDFDDTIYNGKNSELIVNFIVNHPEIAHHIVTYRSGFLLPEMFDILNDYRLIAHFDSFHGCGDYDVLRRISDTKFYLRFKPEVCKRNNIEVLVDDIEGIRPHAKEFGIKFYNSLTDF